MKRSLYLAGVTLCVALLAGGADLAASAATPGAASGHSHHLQHHSQKHSTVHKARAANAAKLHRQARSYTAVDEPLITFGKLGNVADISMFGSNEGWAASSRGVYRTTDGGALWKLVLPGDANMSPGQTDFLSATRGFAIMDGPAPDSYVYATTDGGATWSRSLMGELARTVIATTFLDANHGWVLYAPLPIADYTDRAGVYGILEDGAKTVKLAPAPLTGPVSHGLNANWIKTGIYFQSPTIGWMTGNSWNKAIFLYESKDGGNEWGNVSISSIPKVFAKDLGGNQYSLDPTFFTEKDGVLPVAFNGAGFVLYTTRTDGAFWGATTPVLAKAFPTFDVLDETHIYAAVGKKLMETANLGRSWQTVEGSLPAYTYQIDFVTPTLGYAYALHGLYRTADGGTSWTRVSA
jgi:photosystem II stability/assembly factor-like uncharacterized protein